MVLSNAVPLSSDCFTMWGKDGAATHNREARDATSRLYAVCVPSAAKKLQAVDPAAYNPATLARMLHSDGVSVRHLGACPVAVSRVDIVPVLGGDCFTWDHWHDPHGGV